MKTEEIKHLIEPILTEHHLFLVELKISKDNVIEVFVDALEGVNIQNRKRKKSSKGANENNW